MSEVKQLLLYSPFIVVMGWTVCVAVGLAGTLLTVLGLTATAFASVAHIREELRRV